MARIQLRRGTATEWTAANPTLAPGEMGVELDTGKFKVGNGIQHWVDLPYSSGPPGPGGGGGGQIFLDTDGTPYFDTSASGGGSIALDTDGVPYVTGV